ncbi:MAG: endonuclease domain-containing protein, partial [Actinomycetes bacterium]
TIPADRKCLVPGVIAHRSRRLQPPVSRHGLPCTPAERTLVDCAATSPVEQLHDLLDRSIAAGDVSVRSLLAAVAPGRPGRLPELHGVSALRAALERQGYLGVPRPSVLEGRMARILVATGAPAPRAELSWGADRSYRLDFAYPERRLAVEVDGYAWHATPARMGRDQRRRNELGRAGWLVLVYTWRDVAEEAARVRDEVRATYEARTPVP